MPPLNENFTGKCFVSDLCGQALKQLVSAHEFLGVHILLLLRGFAAFRHGDSYSLLAALNNRTALTAVQSTGLKFAHDLADLFLHLRRFLHHQSPVDWDRIARIVAQGKQLRDVECQDYRQPDR